MTDVLVGVICRLYARLPFLCQIPKETVKKGVLRIKYILPFLLDKSHPVEGLLRRVIFLNYFFTAICMIAYFGYVNFYSAQGVTLQAAVIPMVINWIVATYFSKKFHEIYLNNEQDKASLGESPYIYNSFVAGWISVAIFLWGAAILDDIQTEHQGQLSFQFFFLVVFFNYTTHIFTTEMNIIFAQQDIFHPKWIRAFWICGPLYLIYRNIDFLLEILNV